jgi:acetyl/propionyl-CoA carboxylase alpha subunit
MRRALEEYRLVGIHTVVPFHIRVMDSVDFQTGNVDTNFVAEFLGGSAFEHEARENIEYVAGLAAALVIDRKRNSGASGSVAPVSTQASRGIESNWRRAARKVAIG